MKLFSGKKANQADVFRNPKRYGYTVCPTCDGDGRAFDLEGPESACESCKGFGLVPTIDLRAGTGG